MSRFVVTTASGRGIDRAPPRFDRGVPGAFAAVATILVWLFALLVGLSGAGPAAAQEARIQVARGPYYLGESFEVQVVATDFEEEPTPIVEPGELVGAHLRYLGVSPSTSTSITIVNGKMSRVHEVTFVFRYEVTSTRKGKLRIPEFSVTQATNERRTRGFDVEISGVPTNDGVAISVELPDGPIFVGQKVPISIEFQIDRETQRDLISYRAQIPLFDVPTLRFLDEPPPRTDTQLEVHSAAGLLRLPATSTERVIDGRTRLVVRAERTMIALAPGQVETDAPTVFIDQGTRFRRDLFNQRQATASQKFMATGQSIRLEVAEVPREERPPSFAGAVGRDFTLDVAADRSVVQLGEPILLSFHLRGNGDLSSAGLPPLDAEGLFDPTLYRLPEEPPAGIVDEDGKHFDVTLRVLDANVREIPALAYSWFDAETRGFATTHSRPIALSVGAAEIIGADAVTRRVDPDDAREGRDSASAANAASGAPDELAVRQSSFLQSGANLAVERDLARLLGGEQAGAGHRGVAAALYALGSLFLVFAFVDRRRRDADPELARRSEAFGRAKAEIRAASSSPGAEGAAALGRALRELVAALPEEADAEFDALIEECDALRFAPGASGAPGEGASGSAASLVDRALRFVAARAGSSGDSRGAT